MTQELLIITATEQVVNHKENGEFASGNKANPIGKGGFAENPQNINAGGRPKNLESFVYWLNLFKSMSLVNFRMARDEFEGDQWTVAAEAAYIRIEEALKTDLSNFEAVADRTEGKAPQTIRHEGGLFSNSKLEMVIIDVNTDQPEAEPNAQTSEQSTDS